MSTILVLNGPNLNLLGLRQPEVYGRTTLEEIDALCRARAETHGLEARCVHTNHEGGMIDAVHAAREDCVGLVINAGGYTHTSIALMDAVISVALPCVEVHLSNIHAREEFRHGSYLVRASLGQVCGFGPDSYALAIDGLAWHLEQTRAAG